MAKKLPQKSMFGGRGAEAPTWNFWTSQNNPAQISDIRPKAINNIEHATQIWVWVKTY